MDGRTIILADRDARYRSEVAGVFRRAGYLVESTDSVEDVLHSVMNQRTSVLLLGDYFGENVSLADLVHLLKTLHSGLKIIVVSNELSLAQTRQVRSEGIFYLALKPAASGDTEELGQAVACAFERGPGRVSEPEVTVPRGASAPMEACGITRRAPIHILPPWVAGVLALGLGTGYLCLDTLPAVNGVSSLVTWVFLGVCALIFAGQLLPIFRIKLVLIWRHAWQVARDSAQRGGD